MKKLTLSLILLLIVGVLFAQKTVSFDDFSENNSVSDGNEVQTVMSSFELKKISGFGGPTMSFTSINGEFSVLNGGGGALLINDFFIGGYGEGMSSIYHQFEDKVSIREFSHGGLWLGYVWAPEKIIHPMISTRCGWGNVKGRYSTNNYFDESIYVVVPSVSAEINITRFCKVNLGVEYRQTFGANVNSLKNSDLSSVGAYTSLVFGWF